MFAWTCIGIISYLVLLFLEVYGKIGYFEGLSLPDVPILFVSLMGISQLTYLAAKSIKPDYFSINEIRPAKVHFGTGEEKNIIILGSNLDKEGTVWIEYYPPVEKGEKDLYCTIDKKKTSMNAKDISADEADISADEAEMEENYKYSRSRLMDQFQVKVVTPPPRDEYRIVVSLENIEKDKLKNGEYIVRVEKKGLLTYANSDAKFNLILPQPATTLLLHDYLQKNDFGIGSNIL